MTSGKLIKYHVSVLELFKFYNHFINTNGWLSYHCYDTAQMSLFRTHQTRFTSKTHIKSTKRPHTMVADY